jgi:hypothetical protein
MTDGSGEYHMKYNKYEPTVWARSLVVLALIDYD